jgi:hypothetical protein
MAGAAVELHDSTVGGISLRFGVAIVSFSPAYVHRSEGTPCVDAGTGWHQPARLLIASASAVGTQPGRPEWLADGSLRVDDEVFDNVIPLPFEAAGAVELRLIFSTGDRIILRGTRVRLTATGEATYVEEVPHG